MKFTPEIAAAILLFCSSVSAGPIRARDVAVYGTDGGDIRHTARDVQSWGQNQSWDQSEEAELRELAAPAAAKSQKRQVAQNWGQNQSWDQSEEAELRELAAPAAAKSQKRQVAQSWGQNQSWDQSEEAELRELAAPAAAKSQKRQVAQNWGQNQSWDQSEEAELRELAAPAAAKSQKRQVAQNWGQNQSWDQSEEAELRELAAPAAAKSQKRQAQSWGQNQSWDQSEEAELRELAAPAAAKSQKRQVAQSWGQNSWDQSEEAELRELAAPAAAKSQKRQVKSSKEWAISMAQRKNMDPKFIEGLRQTPLETFEKLRIVGRKLHQATTLLWDGEKPKMITLPTPQTPDQRSRDPNSQIRGKITSKDWFLKWAEMRHLSADAKKAIQDIDPAKFEALKGKPTKERLIEEAKLMKLDDKVKFFNSVDQSVYEEMDKLRNAAKDARTAWKEGKKPTL